MCISYTVEYAIEANRNIADIYNKARDSTAVGSEFTRICNEIERILRRKAHQKGQACRRGRGMKVIEKGTYWFVFTVDQNGCKVRVLGVYPSPPPSHIF